MYRVSPLTYLIAGITATGLHGRRIECAPAELSVFNPPSGLTCGAYLQQYAAVAGGQLYNPTATQNCEYCQLTSADQYLGMSNICKPILLIPSLGFNFPLLTAGVLLFVFLFSFFRLQSTLAQFRHRLGLYWL